MLGLAFTSLLALVLATAANEGGSQQNTSPASNPTSVATRLDDEWCFAIVTVNMTDALGNQSKRFYITMPYPDSESTELEDRVTRALLFEPLGNGFHTFTTAPSCFDSYEETGDAFKRSTKAYAENKVPLWTMNFDR